MGEWGPLEREAGRVLLPVPAVVALDPDARRLLLDASAVADVLFVGDWHGTREIPGLLAGLTPDLAALGYGALALEMPPDEGPHLRAWADGVAELPEFFARPSGDGRGSLEILALVRAVRGAGWHIFGFDGTAENWQGTWASRDHGMAASLGEQCAALPAGMRVLALCGNLHACLAPIPGVPAELWPSCAYQLATRLGEDRIRAADVQFHGGTFFNGNRRRRVETRAWPWPDRLAHATANGGRAFSLEIHLPQSSPATFAVPCGLRFWPLSVRQARLATDDPELGARAIRYLGILLAMDIQPRGVLVYLTARGNVLFHELGADGDSGVIHVFPSVAAAADSGRYRPVLLEQAAREEADLRAEEIELDPAERQRLQASPDAEFLDV